MQQTTRYKFNIIETSDAFGPEALNANTKAVEAELAALEAADAALLTAMGTHGHTCRIATGSYTGTGGYGSGSKKTLSFDFKPLAVFVSFGTRYLLLVRPIGHAYPDHDGYYVDITWGDRSVSWYSTFSADTHMNKSNTQYQYFAIGYEE